MAFCRAALFQSLSSTVCAYWNTPTPARDFLLRRSLDSGSTTRVELGKLRERQIGDICTPRASSGSSKRLRLMRRIVYDGSLEGVVGFSVPESAGVLGSTSMVVVGNEWRAQTVGWVVEWRRRQMRRESRGSRSTVRVPRQ